MLHPAAARARSRATIVSSARKAPSRDGRHRREQQHRRGLDVPADLRAQGAQPRRGHQAGVDREEQGASLVEQPLGGPHLPPDPAPHRVVALPQAEREEPDERPARSQRVQRERGRSPSATGTTARPRQRRRRRRRPCPAPRHRTRSAPASSARNGRSDSADADAPVGARATRRALGRAGCAATGMAGLVHRVDAGEPAQYSPVRTVARGRRNRRRPRRPAPTRAPGQQGAAGADRGVGPTRDRADVHDVAVDPVARRGRPRARPSSRAERQHPGHRRHACAGRRRPDRGAERPGVEPIHGAPARLIGADLVGEPLGEPEPQVHRARRAGRCRGARRRAARARRRADGPSGPAG